MRGFMKAPMKATLVSACLAAFASTAALAQTPPPPKPQATRSGPMEHRPFTKPSERIEARLAYQKTALKITPAQEAQWKAYADFSRKQARDMEQRFEKMRQDRQARRGDGQRPQRPNAIERMERQQAFMAQAAKHLNERIAVQKPLYAALSPEQQKVADQVLNPRGGRGMGQGRHGRGDHGGRGMHGHMMRG